jgi:hypothetical protein
VPLLAQGQGLQQAPLQVPVPVLQQALLLGQQLAFQEVQSSCRQSLLDQQTLCWCLCHMTQSGQG